MPLIIIVVIIFCAAISLFFGLVSRDGIAATGVFVIALLVALPIATSMYTEQQRFDNLKNECLAQHGTVKQDVCLKDNVPIQFEPGVWTVNG